MAYLTPYRFNFQSPDHPDESPPYDPTPTPPPVVPPNDNGPVTGGPYTPPANVPEAAPEPPRGGGGGGGGYAGPSRPDINLPPVPGFDPGPGFVPPTFTRPGFDEVVNEPGFQLR